MSWDEEVMKRRAQIFAERNPQPPMSTATKIVLAVLIVCAMIVCGAAWDVLLGYSI